jgi:N5-(cytidine 5'-diphosphoramidyl)-L-glutamine hydrolase
MKKIAITQRIIKNEEYPEIRDALDINWGSLFERLDYLPIIIPNNFNPEYYIKSEHVDGILFSGGNNLGSITNNEVDLIRDRIESKILSIAIKEKIPVLGICRGMQMIANYFSATICKIKNHAGCNHAVKIIDNTLYKDYFGGSVVVNSYHNYGILDVSDQLLIAAKSQDDSIEAVQHKKFKIYGQMWHPEREKPFDERQLNLIKKIYG